MREREVDTLLHDSSDNDPKGHHESFDTFEFSVQASKVMKDAAES